MYGRERDDANSRLNAYKRVRLGNRSLQEERSWVLYDKNDPRHADIPSDIKSERDLPFGALVMSVDMSPLSEGEKRFLRQYELEDGMSPVNIPPQAHAIYFTGREEQLAQLRVALSRTIDKRVHGDEQPNARNTDHGVAVFVDKPSADEGYEGYHLGVAGNNHPQSPVAGLRRITTGGSLYKVMERISVEGPSTLNSRTLLGSKVMLASPYLAKELHQEVATAVRTSTSSAEKGLADRLRWPDGEANLIQLKLNALAAMDAKILARAEEDRARYGHGGKTASVSGEKADAGTGTRSGGI
ncbi:MAG: hypothetical protein EBV03_09610 [Proteobacteria bacterium]|nr:hypothetical protein [Pseudomonadota bacterium]